MPTSPERHFFLAAYSPPIKQENTVGKSGVIKIPAAYTIIYPARATFPNTQAISQAPLLTRSRHQGGLRGISLTAGRSFSCLLFTNLWLRAFHLVCLKTPLGTNCTDYTFLCVFIRFFPCVLQAGTLLLQGLFCRRSEHPKRFDAGQDSREYYDT